MNGRERGLIKLDVMPGEDAEIGELAVIRSAANGDDWCGMHVLHRRKAEVFRAGNG